MGQRKWYKRVCSIIGALAIFVTMVCIGCQADSPAQGKTASTVAAADEEEPELTAYQEFLDGSRSVYVEEDIREELLQQWGRMNVQPSMFLVDFLEGINTTFREWGYEHKIGHVAYAYLDCGGDGKQELAVKVSGLIPADYVDWTLLLVYEGGNLFLRQVIDSWARSCTTLYAHGYLVYEGSGGAATQYLGESFIDGHGERLLVWEAMIDWHVRSYTDAFEDAGEKEGYIALGEHAYTIAGKEYTIFEEDGEDVSEEQWEQFYALYGFAYGSGCTQEEVDALIEAQRSALGIPKEWLEKQELQWQPLKNSLYKEQIREAALQESREVRQRESDSVLDDKWVACTGTVRSGFYFGDCYEISHEFRDGIAYVLGDYCDSAGIQAAEWSLKDVVSYGDSIFAVVVRCEEPYRVLCFLINSEAITMGLGECTEYIMAADMQRTSEGLRYDSALVWSSYKEQTGWDVQLHYMVEGSTDGLYSFDGQGARAMNHYLKEKHVDTAFAWQLDTNAVCAVNGVKMAVLRYTCEEQEIVLILDELEKTYTIVKGIEE